MAKKKKSIAKELVGKTIRSVKFIRRDDQPAIELNFSDGSCFSLAIEARPTVGMGFYFSAKDGDGFHEDLS